MTRYLIQFADKSTKRVDEEEGKKLLEIWSQGKPIVIRGAGFSNFFVQAIKPINRQWFSGDVVDQDRRLEESKENKKLDSNNLLDE